MNNRKVINNSCYNSYLHFLCWLKESLRQASKKELVHFFEREQTSPKVTEAKERALCGGGKKSFPSRRPAGGTTQSTMQANAEAKRAWTMLSCEEKKMRSILTYSIVLSPQPCYGRRIFSFTPHVAFTSLQPTGSPTDIFYYHTNHLGSTAFVTDQNQNITQGFLYAPFGEITTEYAPMWQNGTLPKYSFNAKELDEETGMYYYEARYYKPPVFTSRDPMFEKYFWMTPYAYCANNPVKYVDPSGEDISTHVDKDGNVIASYDDGNLGVFMHSDEEINDYNINGTRLENDFEKMVGVTLYEKSFEKGDKIDLESNQAEQWLNAFEGFFAHAWTNQIASILLYAMNAGNGDLFDPKSKFSHGSQISKGVYVSPRDLGNFAAGFFGRLSGLSKERTLASFGAFQLAGNNKKEFFNSYSKYYRQALGTMGEGLVPFQKTYGEKGISNYFQRLGYENIRTLEDFNNRYSDIWK